MSDLMEAALLALKDATRDLHEATELCGYWARAALLLAEKVSDLNGQPVHEVMAWVKSVVENGKDE